jgi:hypothetical protein
MRWKKKPTLRTFRPVEFVPIEGVLKPQIEVTALADISGWVTDSGELGSKLQSSKRRKFSLRAGATYYIDEPTARAWIAKGFVSGDLAKPLSEDEIADLRKDLTIIGPGSAGGGVNSG